jgi:hypothetical protein
MLLQPVTNAFPPIELKFGSSFMLPPFRARHTREGECLFREIRVPMHAEHAFHKAWKQSRVDFLERGYSIKAHNGAWTISQWLRPHPDQRGVYTLTPIGQEMLDRARGDTGLLALADEVVELEPLPGDLESKLYDYQVEPARQLYRALRMGQTEWGYPGAWDCSDLGTGKTFQALAAALATGLEVFVMCPLSVIGSFPRHGGRGSGWRGAFAHFGQHPRGIYNYETLRTGNRDFVKIERYAGDGGHPMRRFNWTLDPQHTILLVDEAHKCRTTGSLNQGLVMAAIRQGFPMLLISGTLANNPTQMRAAGRVVGLHKGTDYVDFLRRNGCSGKHKAGKDWKFCGGLRGRRLLMNLHHQVFPARGARTRIQDLGDRFPETQVLAEAFETTETKQIAAAWSAAQYAIETLRKQGEMSEGELENIRRNEYLRAWMASEHLKIPVLHEKIEDEIEQGRSVAVFVNFTEVRLELMRLLKTTCGVYGDQPTHSRNKAIDDFQNDVSRVIICQIKAGGVGISLHDVNGEYPRTAIVLPTNNAEDLKQALGRVHRAGGKSPSRQIIVFAAGTVEEDICNSVRRKLSNIDTLNNGEMNPEATF